MQVYLEETWQHIAKLKASPPKARVSHSAEGWDRKTRLRAALLLPESKWYDDFDGELEHFNKVVSFDWTLTVVLETLVLSHSPHLGVTEARYKKTKAHTSCSLKKIYFR